MRTGTRRLRIPGRPLHRRWRRHLLLRPADIPFRPTCRNNQDRRRSAIRPASRRRCRTDAVKAGTSGSAGRHSRARRRLRRNQDRRRKPKLAECSCHCWGTGTNSTYNCDSLLFKIIIYVQIIILPSKCIMQSLKELLFGSYNNGGGVRPDQYPTRGWILIQHYFFYIQLLLKRASFVHYRFYT